MMYSLKRYMYLVNSLLFNYYDDTYLIKHIRPMFIPTATTIINATTKPNIIYDTPLYSSVNINVKNNDDSMIKMKSKVIYHLCFHMSYNSLHFSGKCRTS
jgi:ABC-type antimicrobial peptide transport system ATPase subunit